MTPYSPKSVSDKLGQHGANQSLELILCFILPILLQVLTTELPAHDDLLVFEQHSQYEEHNSCCCYSKCEKVWHKGLNLPSLPGQLNLLESGLSPPSTACFPSQIPISLWLTWSTRSACKNYHTGLQYRWYLTIHMQVAFRTACCSFRAWLLFPISGIMFLLLCHFPISFFKVYPLKWNNLACVCNKIRQTYKWYFSQSHSSLSIIYFKLWDMLFPEEPKLVCIFFLIYLVFGSHFQLELNIRDFHCSYRAELC